MSQTKIAIVTGGSSGIGLSILKNLEASGVRAISWDIQAPQDSSVPFVSCDVTNEEKVKAALLETEKKFGVVEILINNCGLQFMSPVD